MKAFDSIGRVKSAFRKCFSWGSIVAVRRMFWEPLENEAGLSEEDFRYRCDERILLRITGGMLVLLIALAFLIPRGMGPEVDKAPENQVWEEIQRLAPEARLEPGFVYAIATAESGLNARAKSSVARGLMQMTRLAWEEVTGEPYEKAWDWRTNLRIGVDYLVHCREFLERHDAFTYPLLAASFRYGPYYVKKKGFDLNRIKQPSNLIYKRIFEGDATPLPPPE